MTTASNSLPQSPASTPAWVSMGRFIKISHTLFSLPLVVAGLVVGAGGWPGWRIFSLTLLAAAGARTCAMALNRIIDREIDAKNARTAVRELPSGAISMRQAWLVVVAGLTVYLAAAAMLGWFLVLWSWLPLIVFVGYPYMKRFTPLCHFGVGMGLGLSALAGWLAVQLTWSGALEIAPLAFFGLFWVAGFDIIYATLDIEFDREHGVHSIPARFGAAEARRISSLVHLAAVGCLLWMWIRHGWGTPSLIALLATAFLLYLEQRLAHRVELAFFHINIVVGFAVLLCVLLGVFL